MPAVVSVLQEHRRLIRTMAMVQKSRDVGASRDPKCEIESAPPSKIDQQRSSSSDQSIPDSGPISHTNLSDYYHSAPRQPGTPTAANDTFQEDQFDNDAEKNPRSAKRGSIFTRLQKRVSVSLGRPQPKLNGKRPSIFSVDREQPDSELERNFEREEMQRRWSGDGLQAIGMM